MKVTSHVTFITDSTSKSLISVHSSMYSDGDDICDTTFIDKYVKYLLEYFDFRHHWDFCHRNLL